MIDIINFAPNGAGDIWISIILWLVKLTGVVGGVVLFTLLLKLVTFPFDFMSRWSMRKNSFKMEQMRPELEKLQKQYAGNKEMYNQKMMALYKKNGYSMFGACLPTILTLVIFIIAINGFQSYAGYQNRENFYNMSVSYNNVIYAGFDDTSDYVSFDEKGKVVIDAKALLDGNYSERNENKDGVKFNVAFVKDVQDGIGNGKNYEIKISTEKGYTEYKTTFSVYDGVQDAVWGNVVQYRILVDGLKGQNVLANEKNNDLKIKRVVSGQDVTYNFEQALSQNVLALSVGTTEEEYAVKFIEDICQEKSAETYTKEKAGFLWIQNIWAADSTTAHPIQKDWNTFKTTHGYNAGGQYDIGAGAYEKLIGKLEVETTRPNGYFILVALTIVTSFLTQVVMGKAQKAQMELQTVDGKGAQSQKIMKWMMPIMMAIFAFMYTAAFSIYIILSSVLGILTTLIINFFVDKKMKKELANGKETKIRGRVYNEQPEKTNKPEKQPKKDRDDKFAHQSGEDFLTGKADKKHIRGRKK